ncbi:hypothetical protein BDV19DRAFT_388822 [Aspergillus venezuelensis]
MIEKKEGKPDHEFEATRYAQNLHMMDPDSELEDMQMADDFAPVGYQFRTLGFFYVTNYGLSKEDVDAQFGLGKSVLSLLLEEKQKYRAALEQGDYNGWKPAVIRNLITGVKDNFEIYNIPKFISEHSERPYPEIARKHITSIEQFSRHMHDHIVKEVRKLCSAIKLLETEYRDVKDRSVRPRPSTDPDPGPLRQHQMAVNKVTTKCQSLTGEVNRFMRQVSDEEQPVRKLYEATVKAMRSGDLETQMGSLSIEAIMPCLSPGQRIFDRAHRRATPVSHPNGLDAAERFLNGCKQFIKDKMSRQFPRLCVEVQLYYAQIAFTYRAAPLPGEFARDSTEAQRRDYTPQARAFLEEATVLCSKGSQRSEKLLVAVQVSLKLVDSQRYETVTRGELESIKKAMIVSGHGGMATHSGHWYNCENGHPFAVEECGMPMERARCPECAAAVGGANHRPDEGVTRAIEMEDDN